MDLSQQSAPKLWQKMWIRVLREFCVIFESENSVTWSTSLGNIFWSFLIYKVIYIRNESWKYVAFTQMQQYITPWNKFLHITKRMFFIYFSLFFHSIWHQFRPPNQIYLSSSGETLNSHTFSMETHWIVSINRHIARCLWFRPVTEGFCPSPATSKFSQFPHNLHLLFLPKRTGQAKIETLSKLFDFTFESP